jgi:hypothetical protein
MIFGVYLNTFICMTNRHIFHFLIELVVYINVTPCTLIFENKCVKIAYTC